MDARATVPDNVHVTGLGRLNADLIRALSKNPTLTAARLTLLLLVLYSQKYWDVRVPLVMLAAAGIVISRAALSAVYWAVLAAITLSGAFRRLVFIDNHQVLMAYWCCTLWLTVRLRPHALRTSARLLVGLCFLFATLWKAMSADFADGSFMMFTLLTDSRFAGFGRLVADMSPPVFTGTQDALTTAYDNPGTTVMLASTPLLGPVASLITWTTLVLEGTIALTFLLGQRFRLLGAVRNWALVAFALSTYGVASVIGFGWLLMIMGYAQCRDDEGRARLAYVGAFIALQLFVVPWQKLLIGLGHP